MEKPILLMASVVASAAHKTDSITLKEARTLSVTARATYHASATAGTRVNLYYSPDGTNWDTYPYTYFDVEFTANTTKQQTAIVDVPEHGYMIFEFENKDATYAITNAKIWWSIQSWPKGGKYGKGHEIGPNVRQMK